MHIEYASDAAINERGETLIISDTKHSLIKLDASANIIYQRASDLGQSGQLSYFYNDVAIDNNGQAFTILTVLDEYGLKVVREHILRISSDGKKADVLYTVDTTENESFMRVGRLQSLQLVDDQLYFFSKKANGHSAVLMSLSPSQSLAQTPNVVDVIEMPDNQFLKEIVGTPDHSIYFTTKQGMLFEYYEKMVVERFPNTDTEMLNQATKLSFYNDKVYYIDNHNGQLFSIQSKTTQEPQLALAVDSFIEANTSPYVEEEETTFLNQLFPSNDEFTNKPWSGTVSYFILEDGTIALLSEEQLLLTDESGALKAVYDHYNYSNSYVIYKFIYWIIAILAVWLLLQLLKTVYIDVLNRKVSLVAKQLFIVLPVIILSMFWLTKNVANTFVEQFTEQTYSQLQVLANNGKYLIDGDKLEQLNSPRDYRNDTYREIKSRLNGLFTTDDNRSGQYNTIYRYRDGQLFIIMDDDDAATMYEVFDINEFNQPVIENGTVQSGNWQDATGKWLFALGPIYNSNNELVGVYETGQDFSSIQTKNKQLREDVIEIVVWICIVLSVVITLMTIFFLSSIGKLRRSVNLIATGEWNVKVDIRTRDEVEELGDRFNMMTTAIESYVKEVTTLNNSYIKFVPQQFLSLLGKKKISEVELGNQQTRYMTILVCNVRNFDELTSRMTTEQTFKFINNFLNRFGPIIRQNGGFVSRYLGPGMLTMFPKLTTDALNAAKHIREQLEIYNKELIQQGLPAIDVGIAIHAGEVMLGVIGEELRLEGSVVSGHVQLALDLERVSQSLGVSVLITSHVFESITPLQRDYIRNLGELAIQTQDKAIQLYDWYEKDELAARTAKAKYKEVFESAVEAYRQGRFYDAREGFVQVMKANRNDLIAKYYFFQCDEYYQEGTEQSWQAALKI